MNPKHFEGHYKVNNDGPIVDVLNWLLRNFDYHTAVIIKNTATDVSAVLLGIIIGMAIMVYVLKDTRMVPDPDAEEIHVTKLKKNERTKLFVTVPQYEAGRLSFITGFVMWIYAMLIKFLPIKRLKFIDSRRIRITGSIILLLVVGILVFNILLDSNVILPDGHGGYGVYHR
jgi:hypothetical protein